MRSHVLVLCATGLLSLAGCGGKVAYEVDDGGVVIVDAREPDVRVPSDEGIPDGSVEDAEPFDTGPFVCDQSVDGFTCPIVQKKGASACNDAAIRALSDGCFGASATQETCRAANQKFAACSECMLETFITESGYIDMAPCIAQVSPGNPCAGSIACAYECTARACGDCSYEPGTGTTGASEYEECFERAFSPPGGGSGACWPYGGKEYEQCISDPSFRVCIPATEEDLLPFYRGACRDGGNWSKSATPDGT